MKTEVDDTNQILRLDLPAAPTVLIVDDDPLVLARLQSLVATAGFDVFTASNGMEALKWLESSPASIVITDINMPGMDGLELCRRIREHVWPGYVYLVLLTIRDDEKDVLAGLDAGADDYISKRTSAAHFTARIRTAKRILALEFSLKSALEAKRQLAMTDSLTGIYNRRYFLRHLSRELKRTRRFGGDVSLLLLDVDHFKRVNDTYGHGVGDRVLTTLIKAINKCIRRETDWCARLGGDEFVVVLEGTSVAVARDCAAKILDAIVNTTFTTPTGPIRVSVSIGVSGLSTLSSRRTATVQTLLESADVALYTSKMRGRNRVTIAGDNAEHPSSIPFNRQRQLPDNASMPIRSVR